MTCSAVFVRETLRADSVARLTIDFYSESEAIRFVSDSQSDMRGSSRDHFSC